MLGDINLQQIHGQHVVVLEENKIKMIKIIKICIKLWGAVNRTMHDITIISEP